MVEPTLRSLSAPSDGEIRLIDYVRVIARRRWWILGGTGSVTAIALLTTLALPKQYRSSATLIVSPPKLGDGVPVAGAAVATYRGILQNPSVTAEALQDLGLDKAPHSFDPQNFMTTSVQVEEMPATALLAVHVTMRDAGLAAEVANRIVDTAVKLNQRLVENEARSAGGDIRAQLLDALAKFDQAQKQLLEFKSIAQLDLRKRDAESLLIERQNLLPLEVDIATERARLERAEKELASRERILDVGRMSSEQSNLLTSSIDRARRTEQRDSKTRTGADSDNEVPPGLDVQSSVINPVYEALEFQVATGRTRLAALEKRRSELVDRRKLGGQQIAQLSELYQQESQQARLELDLDLAKKTYQDLAGRYDQARTQVANRTSQLQVIGRALPSRQPFSPRVLRTAVAAASLALVTFLLLAFFIEYVSAVRYAESRSTSE